MNLHSVWAFCTDEQSLWQTLPLAVAKVQSGQHVRAQSDKTHTHGITKVGRGARTAHMFDPKWLNTRESATYVLYTALCTGAIINHTYHHRKYMMKSSAWKRGEGERKNSSPFFISLSFLKTLLVSSINRLSPYSHSSRTDVPGTHLLISSLRIAAQDSQQLKTWIIFTLFSELGEARHGTGS